MEERANDTGQGEYGPCWVFDPVETWKAMIDSILSPKPDTVDERNRARLSGDAEALRKSAFGEGWDNAVIDTLEALSPKDRDAE